MTMNENEWTSLSEVWRSADGGVGTAPLRRTVATHRLFLIIATAAEILLLGALAWVTYAVMRPGITSWKVVWAVSLWVFVVIAYSFVWWNRRGTWVAHGDSVAEYVRLTKLRAERQLRSLRFAVALLIAESVVVIAQLIAFDRLTANAMVFLGVCVAVVALWVVLMRRKIRRDLAIASEFDEL